MKLLSNYFILFIINIELSDLWKLYVVTILKNVYKGYQELWAVKYQKQSLIIFNDYFIDQHEEATDSDNDL